MDFSVCDCQAAPEPSRQDSPRRASAWSNDSTSPLHSPVALFDQSVTAQALPMAHAESDSTTGCIPASTPPVLAMLAAELAACVAEETRTSSLMQTARAIVAQFEELISEEGLRLWGNFSGSAESIAKHARKMKKRFALAIAGRPGSSGARRIRAAPEDDDGNGAAAVAEGAPAALT